MTALDDMLAKADEVLALDGTATEAPWKPDTGVYEDPDEDDDLCFARGPMIHRRGESNVRAWRYKAEADAELIASYRTAAPDLARAVEAFAEEIHNALEYWRQRDTAKYNAIEGIRAAIERKLVKP